MSVDKEQFQLPLTARDHRTPRAAPPKNKDHERSLPERVTGMDQVLNTSDIERITGRHRCTIWRWVRAGTFPGKRAGGGRGWLRSDVEGWLQGNQRAGGL
jgi:predicted DNA-binding transcriptional regulator AlpA